MQNDDNLDGTGPQRFRKGKFLESLEKKVDKENTVQVERLQHLKIQLFEHLKMTKERSTRSITDRKRKGSSQREEDAVFSCPRTSSPQ